MRSIPTSWLKFRRECAAKFPFLKNHRDINKEYLFNICKYLPFTSKNNRQNEKLKQILFKYTAKFVFEMVKVKKKIGFPSILASRKN